VKRKIVLDSFALLAYLQNERGAGKVKRLLAAEGSRALINDINLGEVYYIIGRERKIEDADYFLEVIFPSLPRMSTDRTSGLTNRCSRLPTASAPASLPLSAAAERQR